MSRVEIGGSPGPLEAAAIVAAVARLVEEQIVMASEPPPRPGPGLWVLSGRPRPVDPPFARSAPVSPGWSVGEPVEETP